MIILYIASISWVVIEYILISRHFSILLNHITIDPLHNSINLIPIFFLNIFQIFCYIIVVIAIKDINEIELILLILLVAQRTTIRLCLQVFPLV